MLICIALGFNVSEDFVSFKTNERFQRISLWINQVIVYIITPQIEVPHIHFNFRTFFSPTTSNPNGMMKTVIFIYICSVYTIAVTFN